MMEKQVSSTPYVANIKQERMALEVSAVLPVSHLSSLGAVQERSRIKQEKKGSSFENLVVPGNKKKKITVRSSKTDRDHEYLAKPNEVLDLLYNQYVQMAYLECTKVEAGVSKDQETMNMLLSALMEKNHSMQVELLQITECIINLQNKIAIDEQLHLQTASLKNFDSVVEAVNNMTTLSQALDSKRHVLRLNKIAPLSGDIEGLLREMDRTISELCKQSAAFMEPFAGTSTMTTALTKEAAYLEECSDLSVKLERLAIDEIAFKIHQLL